MLRLELKTPTVIANSAATPAPVPLATSGASTPVLVGGSGLVAALVAVSTAVLSTSAAEVATARV